MGRVERVQPAALIAGIIYTGDDLRKRAEQVLGETFGPIEFTSAAFDFTMTDYYTPEMGGNLRKVFCCFRYPLKLEFLPEAKLKTNAIELRFAVGDDNNPRRTVNIDPGYVTLAKLVLATTKDYSHRIYIGEGIYAETTLRFKDGKFSPVSTTYPDYSTPLAIAFFNDVRAYVKENMEQWTKNNG